MGCGASSVKGIAASAGQARAIVQGLGPGQKWTDPEFPPQAASIDPAAPPAACVWRRASELWGDVALFKGRCSVRQGALGDCWLISALSIIATRPDILRTLVVAQYPDHGLYEFRFFKEGRWRTVVVDDHLPVVPARPAELLFARSTTEGELWVPLFEKAYAKLHGSYHALEGGCNGYALVDLTGGASEFIAFDGPTGRNLVAKGWVLPKLRQCRAEGWLMGCSFMPAEGRPSSHDTRSARTTGTTPARHGLIAGHAYAILDIAQVQVRNAQVWLLKLRNPWGEGHYAGPWSGKSPEWANVVPPQFRLPCDEGDGEFWIDFETWQGCAAALSICRTYRHSIGEPWYVTTEPNGEWRGETSCGAKSHKNPQYLVMAEQTTVVCVFLMQDDLRYLRRKANCSYEDRALGLCLARARSGERLGAELFAASCFLFGTNLSASRSICVEFLLEEGECYALMPCLQRAGAESHYFMYLFSTAPVRMKKTTERVKEEDEYDCVVLAKERGEPPVDCVWSPEFRNKTYNGAPGLPSQMQVDVSEYHFD